MGKKGGRVSHNFIPKFSVSAFIRLSVLRLFAWPPRLSFSLSSVFPTTERATLSPPVSSPPPVKIAFVKKGGGYRTDFLLLFGQECGTPEPFGSESHETGFTIAQSKANASAQRWGACCQHRVEAISTTRMKTFGRHNTRFSPRS